MRCSLFACFLGVPCSSISSPTLVCNLTSNSSTCALHVPYITSCGSRLRLPNRTSFSDASTRMCMHTCCCGLGSGKELGSLTTCPRCNAVGTFTAVTSPVEYLNGLPCGCVCEERGIAKGNGFSNCRPCHAPPGYHPHRRVRLLSTRSAANLHSCPPPHYLSISLSTSRDEAGSRLRGDGRR